MIDVIKRAAELEERGESYVLATVVRVDRPVSARVGDRAIVHSDGRVEGWIGGSCSEPIVVREALTSIGDRESRLVRIRPPGSKTEPQGPGVVTEVTACASEGGLDVFVEPRLRRPQLAIAGSAPAARTLARLARELGYRVTAVLDTPAEQSPDANLTVGLDGLARMDLGVKDAVVVASMNRYDETALEAALQSGAAYIGLVASRPRAAKVLEMLRARGIRKEGLERIHSPAGLDLGPSDQEEIALAVLAEVVQARHTHEKAAQETMCPPAEAPAGQATDPVCGMTVVVHEGAISTDVDGTVYYFCSPGCRDSFTRTDRAHLRSP